MPRIIVWVHALMSTKQRGGTEGERTDRDFRERSTLTAHKYPTKARLHDKQTPGESYEETILRLLDELEDARDELEQLRGRLEEGGS